MPASAVKAKTLNAGVLLFCAILLCSCMTGFSQTTNSFFQFIQAQSQRRYTQVPHEVLAVYYGWYGQPPGRDPWHGYDTNKHEIFGTQRYPVKGPYSSHDVDVIDWQIDQAKAHGITGFMVSWWGVGEWESWVNKGFALLLERAEKKDFKIGVYWEQAPGDGRGQIERAIGEISYVLKQYGHSQAFLKANGRPAIFAYGRVMEQVPVSAWPEIINGIRARGGDFALFADGQEDSFACIADGVHTYWLEGIPYDLEHHLTTGKLGELRTWAARSYQRAVNLARKRGRISCLTVAPGNDQRKAYKFDWIMDRLDGRTYRTLWEEARKANPDWILITSWNEWPEGSEIEPSLEFGDAYLKITAEYAGPFLSGAPVNAPPPAPLPRFASGTTNAAGEVLSGRTVGVLTQVWRNDSEFWAAYCGASLRRFAWIDLVDPKVFNASNVPVLIHIGTETYVSSAKATDDVTLALARYLHEGGFLVTLPAGAPWPLHYDESRKNIPYAITDKLALGIDNGFEQPTNGVELTFYTKTNVLFGLPATAPFPSAGDLRWRPTNRSRVPASEIYVPLIQLRDNTGKTYGDAVSYIEHRTPSLAGGKSLHVWMRTSEAFGPDVFLPSLYQFISTRLKPLQADD
jgi:glycoprotein endo-alpha-1,2-mannosidase